MIYPVGDGTRETFKRDWYIASDFGEDRGRYIHSGQDINLKTGGNSDLGEKIIAISDYTRSYYHYKSHPQSGFGIHFVYKIVGPWGARWVHCAHAMENPEIGASGKQGDTVGRIGKSGTNYAHLHFSIFKVDPITLPNKIDTIARTKIQLNQWWEDPTAFIEKYYGDNMSDDALEACMKDRESMWKQRDEALADLEACKTQSAGYKSRITDLGNQLGEAQAEVKNREEQVHRLKAESANKDEQIALLDTRVKDCSDQVNQLAKEKGALTIEVQQLKTQLETAQQQGEFTVTIGEFFSLLWNQKITIGRKS